MPTKPNFNKISDEIALKVKDIADRIKDGYTVTIRPTKDGVKITTHKEKVL